MRRRIMLCAVMALTIHGTAAAQTSEPRASAAGAGSSTLSVTVTSPDANAPLLRSLISLDIRNAPLGDALREVSKQMGGRLMFDESATALRHRVTLKEAEISSGQAIQRIIAGTNLRMLMVNGGSMVLVKPDLQAARVIDSVTVRGQVVDEATGKPVPQVAVATADGRRRAQTNDLGNFVLPRVPAGERQLSFRRIGYRSMTLRVTLSRDTSIVVPMTLAPSVLSAVVTTGSGERSRLEIGNSVAVTNADSVMLTTPVHSVSQLMANRLPGLLATTGSGSVGAPTRLRVRGNSSIESNNNPIVIVDGVKISTDATTAVTNTLYAGVYGGSRQYGANDLSFRLDDLDPNSIESIELLKGPAASTLYGSEAANGVLVIKTKRGQAGPARWSFYGDYRSLSQVKDYDYPVKQLGYPISGAASANPTCTISNVFHGSCIPDEGALVGFNMLEDPRFTPQARGHTGSIGANVSGGTENIQYFLGGTYLDQLGTTKLPDVNRAWIEHGRGGQTMSSKLIRPNARTNASVNARITGRMGSTADFALGTHFISQYQRVGSDGMAGLLSEPRLHSDTTPVMAGWEQWYGTREQELKHVLGSASANWRPEWRNNAFTASVTYGWDLSLTDDEYFAAKGSCNPLCTSTTDQGVLGYINTGRRSNFVQTLNLGTTFHLPVTSWLSTSTRVGGNYSKTHWYDLYGSATNLGVGRKLYAASGTKQISDIGDERATAGWYLEEQFNLRNDRLFVTFGVRQDAGSSLGETVRPVFPKWNASWLLSEESFFPLKDYISLFRARFAVGSAGVMPSSTARLRTYAMGTNFVLDDDAPTGSFAELGSPGNPDLKAEHSREYEGGVDIELFDRRLTLEATYFHKYTKDAIHRGPLAGSVGSSVVRPLISNLGDVENWGWEGSGSLRVLDNDRLSYTVIGSLTQRNNRLTRLADGVVTFLSVSASGDLYTGNETRIEKGYPLFGRWAYPIKGWSDLNSDGRIDPLEVWVGDSLEFVGPSEPKYTGYIGNQVALFNNRLTINANFSFSSGLTQFNQARKNMAQYTAAQHGVETSHLDQACIAASAAQGQRRATDWCFMETVKLLRFQDLSIGYNLPPAYAGKIGASSASIVFSASNLHHWSNYRGRDPGINTAPVTGNAVLAGAAFGAPREYGMRVQLYY